MAKFDPQVFNTDPKHQEQRDFLDAIVEGSARRLAERIKKEKDKGGNKDEENPFDALFGKIMGGSE